MLDAGSTGTVYDEQAERDRWTIRRLPILVQDHQLPAEIIRKMKMQTPKQFCSLHNTLLHIHYMIALYRRAVKSWTTNCKGCSITVNWHVVPYPLKQEADLSFFLHYLEYCKAIEHSIYWRRYAAIWDFPRVEQTNGQKHRNGAPYSKGDKRDRHNSQPPFFAQPWMSLWINGALCAREYTMEQQINFYDHWKHNSKPWTNC